jgi:hypothetical protein
MTVKLFEIRDAATFIAAMATQLRSRDEAEFYLLRRAGYSKEQIAFDRPRELEPYVLLTNLDGRSPCNYDVYNWHGNRTMQVAHAFIIEHWDTLQSGAVIDVEFILGERPAPKTSERFGETNFVRSLQETDRFIP